LIWLGALEPPEYPVVADVDDSPSAFGLMSNVVNLDQIYYRALADLFRLQLIINVVVLI
jgi:hypothetical protein